MPLSLEPPLPPMETRSADEIPVGDDWQYEPKWDGFRCPAFRDGKNVFLQSKAGQPLARYFPDIVTQIQALKAKHFVLDGELVIPIGTALSFDELQLRLHPAASRVQKLAAAHPPFSSCSICSRSQPASHCSQSRCANVARSSNFSLRKT